jgi:hypothetical protein
VGLEDIIRSAVSIADSVSEDVQEDVVHQTWVGQDTGFGKQKPTVNVVRKALVEQKLQKVRLEDGTLVSTIAKLTFLKPIAPNGAVGRVEPIDPNDTFVLADGTIGHYLPNVQGLRKGTPFLLEVWLG